MQEMIRNGFATLFTGYLCLANSPREIGILAVAQELCEVFGVPVLAATLIYSPDRIKR